MRLMVLHDGKIDVVFDEALIVPLLCPDRGWLLLGIRGIPEGLHRPFRRWREQRHWLHCGIDGWLGLDGEEWRGKPGVLCCHVLRYCPFAIEAKADHVCLP